MIELDQADLGRVLPAKPELAGWDDVMTRSRAHTGRRHRRLVVLAAAAVLVLATASAFGVRALILDEGFIGVPPDGATPSTPERGELVLSYDGHPAAIEGRRLRAFLYADGRLIWDRNLDFQAALQSGQPRTGFLEQRLTPEGVELLLSEVISTGLFDRDVTLVRSGGSHIPNWAVISVRNGNRLVTVDWGGALNLGDLPTHEPTPEQESAIERLGARLVDPGSWLPASAWENREIRPYVASRYEVCVGVEPPSYPVSTNANAQPLELSELLTMIPAAPAELLREAEFTAVAVTDHCSDVTTEKARAIAKALDAAGVERVFPGSVLYSFVISRPGRGLISFAAYLPHGTICELCG